MALSTHLPQFQMASIDTLEGNCTFLFYLVLQVANFIIARCGHWKNDVFAFYEDRKSVV